MTEPKDNILERIIRTIAPTTALKRMEARMRLAMADSYHSASITRTGLRNWIPRLTDANSNTIPDIPMLRARSRDLVRNNPIACGAITTIVTNVVGYGVIPQSVIDREILPYTDDEADVWEANAEREFALWAEAKDADISGALTFYELQDLVLRSMLESGDVFVVQTYRERPGRPYGLALQVVEADRICNPQYAPNTARMISGVELDEDGRPVAYHIASRHPLSMTDMQPIKWTRVPLLSPSGRRQVLHLKHILRPGQTRGVPYLAPVIETLKQLSRYTEAELQAAVVSGLFTVFIKSEYGVGDGGVTTSIVQPADISSAQEEQRKVELKYGGVVELLPGEDVTAPTPGRPNNAFDPFVNSLARYIGVALGIPKEILMKEFTASYSAARAALLEMWKFISQRRSWLADNFCQPVYEWWMDEAVAGGRIPAPGYFDDPLLRAAYLGCKWIGPAKGMINENDEVQAAIARIDAGISTLAEETAQLTGGDWATNHRQRIKEYNARKSAGLLQQSPSPSPSVSAKAPQQQIIEEQNIEEQTHEQNSEQKESI